MSAKTFILQFLKKGNKVGAVAPSSRFLAAKMLKHIPFDHCETIVEFGPGTGAFTGYIQKRMKPTARLIIIELNETFYHDLNERFANSNTEIIQGSATDLSQILADRGIQRADCIISSLPLAIFNETLREQILAAAHQSLSHGGHFVQFQYSLQSKKAIQRHFNQMNLAFTPLNLPPAFVYSCKK
ncbi:MAG: class I SAM-dependent methyltransferase [Flavobacteriales bacterium]